MQVLQQIRQTEAIWLDDMVDVFGSFHSVLGSQGIHTQTSELAPSQYGKDKLLEFDCMIVDSKFNDENWHEGLDFAREMLAVYGKRVIVFSGFIDAHNRHRGIVTNPEKSSAILYLPKVIDLSKPIDDFVKNATSCMAKFFNIDFHLLEDMGIPDFEEDFGPVKPLGVDEFHSLGLRDKRALYREFEANLQIKPDYHFGNGAIWVFYAGNSQQPFKIAHHKSEILASEEVDRICRELDCAPFIFRSDIKVNTTGCATEAANRDTGDHLSSYPVAGLNFASAKNEPADFREIHFDTGADYSFICNDFAMEQELSGEYVTHLGSVKLHGAWHLCDLHNIQVILRGRTNQSTQMPLRIAHQMSTIFVDEWNTSGLFVTCSDACLNQAEGLACRHRKIGLLGRTSYICAREPDVKRYDIHLDGKSSRVFFGDERQEQ